jgi:hypothetical protein
MSDSRVRFLAFKLVLHDLAQLGVLTADNLVAQKAIFSVMEDLLTKVFVTLDLNADPLIHDALRTMVAEAMERVLKVENASL